MVGYGVIFAGFNPQLTYTTPKFAGIERPFLGQRREANRYDFAALE